MIEIEKAFWLITGTLASLITGQYVFARNRNIRIEQRITSLESNKIPDQRVREIEKSISEIKATQVTTEQVKEMIEEAQKPLTAVLQDIRIAMNEHKDVTDRLSGLVGELNVKTAVLEEKMRND